jgi:hypothetical protein
MDPVIKALVFDVLGTTVDWRSSVVAELKKAELNYGLEQGTNETSFYRESIPFNLASTHGDIDTPRSH